MEDEQQIFLQKYTGCFTNILRWPQLDQLWRVLISQNNKNWYCYATNKDVPINYSNHETFIGYINDIDRQLRQLHKYDYCGIVYADNPSSPEFIKIYHPKNLGANCGSSGERPLPAWILSTLQPSDKIIKSQKPTLSHWKQVKNLFNNIELNRDG